MLNIIVEVVYSIGITFGVGASTFALVFYIQALSDGEIDASERRLMKTVYVVLRIGMTVIFVALVGDLILGTGTLQGYLFAWILLGIITLNAILMSHKIMPMRFGPVLAGGSWYSLFLVSNTPIGTASFGTAIIAYGVFLVFFYIVFHFFKKKYSAPSVDQSSCSVEVVTDKKALIPYATDTSSFKIEPKAVYYPKNASDIVALTRMCHEYRRKGIDASLTVRAGGTCMSGGPLNSGWIVDMTKHMHDVTIDPKRMTATVEMGAYFRDIEDAARTHNLMFAAYPSSRRICGIGGMLGNNASGEKSLRGGATSDNVLELEVVLADGTIERVVPKDVQSVTQGREKELLALHTSYGTQMREATGEVKKSASGYRFEKMVDGRTFSAIPLFVGAQGTLGIITKAVLKLAPIPKYTELVVISGQSLKDISAIIETVRAHNPEGLETFDSNTFAKAREHLSEHANRMLPYIDAKAHLFILAQFSENTKVATKKQAQSCLQDLTTAGYVAHHVTNEADVASIWEVRRNSFLLMRDHNPSPLRAVPCIEDVIVPLSAMGEFITKLRTILKKRTTHYGYHGHIGDGSFRVIPVFDFSSPTVSEEIVTLMKEVFALVKRLRGNISADHSDGIIRSPFLKEFYGEELYGVFEQIKDLYDPENIMNPHKKVGGTIEFLKQSLDTTHAK